MKKLVLLVLLCVGFLTQAQEPIEKKLGDFNTIKVFNGLQVTLNKTSKASIEISGVGADDVTVKNSDGILKIRLSFPDKFVAEDVHIVINYTNSIDVIDANEGCRIESKEPIKQQHLEVKAQEGAQIDIDVDIKHLIVKSVTGGIIELSGASQNQSVEVNTGGIYESFEMKSKQAIVVAASGGRAEVTALEVLDAKVRFGGNIFYKGTPEVLKTKKIMGGVIKDKN